jgi:DNA helicase-2/ATP-dependent DNA helicase PcrA
MEYANKYLNSEPIVPIVRNGEVVTENSISNVDELISFVVQKTEQFKSKVYENIAIICKDIKETEKIFDIIKDIAGVKIINSENAVYHSGLVVIPSYFAKGLEFDAVIMVLDETGDRAGYKQEDKLRYVMATRALHELHVVVKNSF